MGTIHILLREHQDHYGFIETDVVGVYVRESDALKDLACDKVRARRAGMRTCGDDDKDDDGDWQVHWRVEAHELSDSVRITAPVEHDHIGP